jgi:IS30 family transposase
MRSIGQMFNRNSSSIYPLLSRTGGIRPPVRKRSRLALTLVEREEISRGLATERSLRSIARTLRRSASTISREVHRNGGRDAYRAACSDRRAWDCARRPKSCKLSFNKPLCQLITRKLRLKWSPQQIAGWLKRRHPDEEQIRVSHETIYRSLYVQTRGVLKKELQDCLRSPRAIRRSRHATQKGLRLRKIKGAVPISERPPEIEDRAVPGHWEGDLIVGSNNSYIATLVERHSRFLMLAKVENKDTQSVIAALIKQARKLPKELYRSLTWDRGSEMTGTASSRWQQRSTSIFAIHNHHGNAAATKTPTGFCASTSRKALICLRSVRRNSAPSRGSSTSAQERPCNTKPQPRNLSNVLRRSVETAAA